jgi:hypothetical protein
MGGVGGKVSAREHHNTIFVFYGWPSHNHLLNLKSGHSYFCPNDDGSLAEAKF